MEEEEFKRLRVEVLRKAGLVNMQLRNKKSLAEALKNNDITEDKFKLLGWEYNSNTNAIERVHYVGYKDLKAANNIVVVVEDKALNNKPNAEIMDSLDKSKLQDLIDNYNILSKIIEMFKANQEINLKNNNIVIELPQEENKSFKVSYRVNQAIHNEFKEFCKEHKEFTSKDLLSMALKEFMDKYKKSLDKDTKK